MPFSESYRVTVWNKQVDEPYYILNYELEETAKYVARRMKEHYVEEWGGEQESIYHVRLQKIQGDE